MYIIVYIESGCDLCALKKCHHDLIIIYIVGVLMEANDKDVDDQEHLDEVPWSQLTTKQKQQRQARSEAGVRARKKHLEKRVMRPISLNTEKPEDQVILDVISSKEFSLTAWFRFIFHEYSQSEMSLLKKGNYVMPCMLIEKSIEEGFFDLDAYLEAKGQKIVKSEASKDPLENYEYE